MTRNNAQVHRLWLQGSQGGFVFVVSKVFATSQLIASSMKKQAAAMSVMHRPERRVRAGVGSNCDKVMSCSFVQEFPKAVSMKVSKA